MITDQAKLAGGVTAVLERPGARLFYEVAGDGPAVVLIHGFGLDLRMWDPQAGPLAARFRVVRRQRPADQFRPGSVDTSPRPAVTETPLDHLRSLS